ncbi:MAG: hypothetical protein KBC64_02835 [Simkaniaceae bacterium]|nr:hypothetical protein [Simkaniaceae bacterium]
MRSPWETEEWEALWSNWLSTKKPKTAPRASDYISLSWREQLAKKLTEH